MRNEKTEHISTTELVPGDVIFLVGGNIVPADTKWLKGDILQVDTAALTGEPIPRKYPGEHGDVILSGTTVAAGECYGVVIHTGLDTEIGKAQSDILKDKTVRIVSVFQRKIMTVVQILVSFSLLMVVLVLLVEGTVYGGFATDLKKTILDSLSILIASIPIALPLVLNVNLALGASFLAKRYHAIVTSIPALQDIASMSILCSDKTGTLTTANMSVISDQIFATDGFSKDEVLLYAYLCSNSDKKDDPIDKAVVAAFMKTDCAQADDFHQIEIIGFNPSVKRVVAFVKHGEEMITIAKGLPAKVIDTEAGSLDDHELQWKVRRFNDKAYLKKLGDIDMNLSKNGYKTIGISICKGNARELGSKAMWEFIGLLPMLDPPRNDTKATINSLHHANISVKMITGDHVNVGKETARLIGLGVDIRAGEEVRNASLEEKKQIIWQADGFAAVLPSDKRDIVLNLRNEHGVVTAMTGDGVNDAAALSASHVGIAVMGATDAAKNAADLILTEPGLSPIYGAVIESRRIFVRIKAYIVYRVAASLILVLTLSTIIFSTGCGVDPLFIIILALLNDLSMIPVAYDNANATTKPQMARTKKLVLVAIFYGIIHTIAAMIFIFSVNHDARNNINLMECNDETQGFVWYYLVLVTELMIFSIRAPSFCLLNMPSIYLLISVLGTCIIGGLLACLASELSVDQMAYITAMNIAIFLVVDLLKIAFRKVIDDEQGDVIKSDELIEPPPVVTDLEKQLKKNMRYVTHMEAKVPMEDATHTVSVRSRTMSMMEGFFLGNSSYLGDGLVSQDAKSIYNQVHIAQTYSLRSGPPARHHPGRYKQTSMPW